MTRTDAEAFFNNMSVGTTRLFKYRQEFILPHYVNIRKDSDNSVILVIKDSTTNINDLDKDMFVRMLMREELVESTGHGWNTDVNHLRTGGCSCGAWATTEPNCHSYWCIKHGK